MIKEPRLERLERLERGVLGGEKLRRLPGTGGAIIGGTGYAAAAASRAVFGGRDTYSLA